MKMKKVYITTEEIRNNTKKLAEKLKNIFKNKKIYLIGINRGGLIPTGYLSYFLDTRNVKIIDINLYPSDKHRDYNKNDILKLRNDLMFINFLTEKDIVIFVDDLIDTGSTFNLINETLKNLNVKSQVIFASIYGKETDLNNIYGEKKPEGWLVFPWD
jgi:hypoxanthine phosphoribosyltransferase